MGKKREPPTQLESGQAQRTRNRTSTRMLASRAGSKKAKERQHAMDQDPGWVAGGPTAEPAGDAAAMGRDLGMPHMPPDPRRLPIRTRPPIVSLLPTQTPPNLGRSSRSRPSPCEPQQAVHAAGGVRLLRATRQASPCPPLPALPPRPPSQEAAAGQARHAPEETKAAQGGRPGQGRVHCEPAGNKGRQEQDIHGGQEGQQVAVDKGRRVRRGGLGAALRRRAARHRPSVRAVGTHSRPEALGSDVYFPGSGTIPVFFVSYHDLEQTSNEQHKQHKLQQHKEQLSRPPAAQQALRATAAGLQSLGPEGY